MQHSPDFGRHNFYRVIYLCVCVRMCGMGTCVHVCVCVDVGGACDLVCARVRVYGGGGVNALVCKFMFVYLCEKENVDAERQRNVRDHQQHTARAA